MDGRRRTFSANTGNTTTYTPPSTPDTYLITATLQSTGQTIQREVSVQAGPATQIMLQPATSLINIVAGDTVMLTATLLDAASNPTTNGTVNWASSGGSFNGAGFTRVFSPTNVASSYWITATLASNGQSASRQIIVSAANAASISTAQSATSITAGSTAWFTATVHDAFGNVISNGDVTWSKASGPGNVTNAPPRSATLTTGAGTGMATLQASYAGLNPVTTTISVNAGNPAQLNLSPLNPGIIAGSTIAFTALVSDSFGNTTSIGNVQWDVLSGPGALTNTQSRAATFTSTVASPSVIRAGIAGATDVTTTVNVNPAGVAKITLSPPNATLPVNASQGFSAFAYDAFNNAISNAAFAWSSADTTKATVNANGSSATLSATHHRRRFCRPAAGEQWRLHANDDDHHHARRTEQHRAVAGNRIHHRLHHTIIRCNGLRCVWQCCAKHHAAVWSVNGAQVGQIPALDGDTALFTGSTVAGVYPAGVRVSTGSITQTADITLNAGALSAVTLNPNGITLLPNASIGIVATGRDRFGNPISGLTFNWNVVGGAGTITPNSPGSAGATFQASTVAGSYMNAVQASTSQGDIDRTSTARRVDHH